MLMNANEVRESILKKKPMTFLYWDTKLENWAILVSKNIRLPGNLEDYLTNSRNELPEIEEYSDIRMLIFKGNLICYIIICDKIMK